MSKRVLIVDDEPGLLSAVATCMRVSGYEVMTAHNGREALARVGEAKPDLVISDVRMPEMDGFALARHLRNSPQTAHIPIVMLTAYSETAGQSDGMRAKVDAFLVKPFEPDDLLGVVEEVLNDANGAR